MTSRKRPMFPPRPDRRPIRFRPGGRRARTFGRGGGGKINQNRFDLSGLSPRATSCTVRVSACQRGQAGMCPHGGPMQIDTVSVQHDGSLHQTSPRVGLSKKFSGLLHCEQWGPRRRPATRIVTELWAGLPCCPFPIPPRLPPSLSNTLSRRQSLWTKSGQGACTRRASEVMPRHGGKCC